jgi:hypothetical protein
MIFESYTHSILKRVIFSCYKINVIKIEIFGLLVLAVLLYLSGIINKYFTHHRHTLTASSYEIYYMLRRQVLRLLNKNVS